MGAHPDQRMHDDTLKLCDLSVSLGVGLLQAAMLFGSFSSVLWVLSKDFSIFFDGQDHALPGFMLWAAILYAIAGSLMTYWVGNGLISRNAERYAREGELRFSLTRINEHLDGISLAGGEADEKRRVAMHLGDVLHATSRVVLGLTNLTWVTAGFGWVTVIAPTLVAAPLYFSGKVSFGGLMMAAAAFTQAQSSLRWFVDNFSALPTGAPRCCASPACVRCWRPIWRHNRAAAASPMRERTRNPRDRSARGARLDRPRSAGRRKPRRARRSAPADPRHAGHREDLAVPGARGPLALGLRHRAPAPRRDDPLHAARHALPSPRHAGRSAVVCDGAVELSERSHGGRACERGPPAAGTIAGQDGSLGARAQHRTSSCGSASPAWCCRRRPGW
jgi:hypothetical protein